MSIHAKSSWRLSCTLTLRWQLWFLFPIPVYQEVGYAFVLAKPDAKLGPEVIASHCRGKLANYKMSEALRDLR